jgi:hypothetical protein
MELTARYMEDVELRKWRRRQFFRWTTTELHFPAQVYMIARRLEWDGRELGEYFNYLISRSSQLVSEGKVQERNQIARIYMVKLRLK